MKLCVVISVFLALVACAPEPSNVKVIVGGTLVDPAGNRTMEHVVVVVEGPTIRAVGPQARIPIPAGSEKVSGTGKIIAPSEGTGPIEMGKPANLVLMSDGRVERTMVNGEWVDPN